MDKREWRVSTQGDAASKHIPAEACCCCCCCWLDAAALLAAVLLRSVRQLPKGQMRQELKTAAAACNCKTRGGIAMVCLYSMLVALARVRHGWIAFWCASRLDLGKLKTDLI